MMKRNHLLIFKKKSIFHRKILLIILYGRNLKIFPLKTNYMYRKTSQKMSHHQLYSVNHKLSGSITYQYFNNQES